MSYLAFGPVAAVFAAVFACVVFGQLILAELLELVSHCLLQAHRQGAAEALETDTHCYDCFTGLKHPDSTTEAKTYCAVDSDDFQPIRGQLHSGTEVSADVWLCGGQIGSQSQ